MVMTAFKIVGSNSFLTLLIVVIVGSLYHLFRVIRTEGMDGRASNNNHLGTNETTEVLSRKLLFNVQKKLRYNIHSDYLLKYQHENLVPLGLQLHKELLLLPENTNLQT